MKLLYVYSSPFCQLQLSWLKGNLIDVTKWHRMTLAQCGDTLTNAGNSRAENKVPPCCGSTLRVCQLYFENGRCCMSILSLKQDAGKQKFLNCTVTSKQDEGYLTLFIPVWSISSNKEKCAFPVRHTACFNRNKNTKCGWHQRQWNIAGFRRKCSWKVSWIISNIQSMCPWAVAQYEQSWVYCP